jgi:predicted transcriptional regulator
MAFVSINKGRKNERRRSALETKVLLLEHLSSLKRKEPISIFKLYNPTERPEGISLTRASHIMHKNSRDSGRIISEMEEEGLITVETDEWAKVVIILTPKGYEVGQMISHLNRMISKVPKELIAVSARQKNRSTMHLMT